MGVRATFCQLCGLPVQHDHYVTNRAGSLNIYRGSMERGGHDWSDEPHQPFPFTDAHAWLLDAVGVRVHEEGVVRGTVEDGGLKATDGDDEDELYVGSGNEDALVFHHFCWELMGSPEQADHAFTSVGQLGWEQLYVYQEQLFDFVTFTAHGKSEWLLDPSVSTRSRARIERLLANAKRATRSFDEPTTLDDVLRVDRDWRGTAARNAEGIPQHHVRYRSGPSPAMDRSAFPHLLCFLKHYGSGLPGPDVFMALEELEVQVRDALEADGFGVAVLQSMGEGKMQCLAYVKDLAEGHRRVDALPWAKVPGASEYDDANDPDWKIFFEQMGLPQRQG